jgi:Mitochondrial resolvase Ydc2 / RNA splicing MRS1
MSSVLSIDVGIKNLSFCFFKDGNIEIWDNIDLTEKHDTYCCECSKKAKYIYNQNNCIKGFCLAHAKKQKDCLMFVKELSESYLKKQKIGDLLQLCEKYNLSFMQNFKKQQFIDTLLAYSKANFLQEVEKTNATKVDLSVIAENIMYKYNSIFSQDIHITHVIIENQIGPLANKMKTIQGMLVQYFVMRSPTNIPIIEFISASNKLKEFTPLGKKLDYKERKKLSIEVCSNLLDGTQWKNYMQGHSKKDDLCDCYLQGLWFLKNKL